MTETTIQIIPKPDRYRFDTISLENDLVILQSTIQASDKINRLLNPLFKAGKILGHFASQETVIEKKLINTAILLRMIDDRFIVGKKKCHLYFTDVGQMTSEKVASPLTLREACNKIVHANGFKINYKVIEGHSYIDTIISLTGTQGKSNWAVDIDIDRYVINGLCMTKICDDDWDL